MKKRKFIVTAVLAVLLIMTVTLSACFLTVEVDENSLGDKLPKNIEVPYKIDGNMSALEMYNIGLKNFAAMEYVATLQSGAVNSTAIGFKVGQKLTGRKIKDGDDYYYECYTIAQPGSVKKVHAVEELIYKDGKVAARGAKKVRTDKDGNLSELEWKEIDRYSSLDAALKDYPNDPTRANLYIVNNDTILEVTKPVYDAKLDQYRFSFVLDPVTATEDYIVNMYHQTSYDSTAAGKKITFKSLKLDVVIWGNGLIKMVTNTESYDVDFMGTSSNFVSDVRFTYNKKEMPIKDYINKFE